MATKTESQRIGAVAFSIAEAFFERAGWNVINVDGTKDYGTDAIVEIFVGGKLEPLMFNAQIKGTTDTASKRSVPIRIETLNDWTERSRTHSPTLIVLVDIETSKLYGRWADHHDTYPNYPAASSTMSFDESDELNDVSGILGHVKTWLSVRRRENLPPTVSANFDPSCPARRESDLLRALFGENGGPATPVPKGGNFHILVSEKDVRLEAPGGLASITLHNYEISPETTLLDMSLSIALLLLALGRPAEAYQLARESANAPILWSPDIRGGLAGIYDANSDISRLCELICLDTEESNLFVDALIALLAVRLFTSGVLSGEISPNHTYEGALLLARLVDLHTLAQETHNDELRFMVDWAFGCAPHLIQDAVTHLDAAASVRPEMLKERFFYEKRALAADITGRVLELVETYERWLENCPDSFDEVRGRYLDSLLQSGQFETAVTEYQRIFPEDASPASEDEALGLLVRLACCQIVEVLEVTAQHREGAANDDPATVEVTAERAERHLKERDALSLPHWIALKPEPEPIFVFLYLRNSAPLWAHFCMEVAARYGVDSDAQDQTSKTLVDLAVILGISKNPQEFMRTIVREASSTIRKKISERVEALLTSLSRPTQK